MQKDYFDCIYYFSTVKVYFDYFSPPYAVKVYTTECPQTYTVGPSWYMIEALTDDGVAVGKFTKPGERTEAIVSNNHKVSMLIIIIIAQLFILLVIYV